MPRHKTVLVRWKDQSAYIDKRIAPLILELWKAEIATVNSCEENRPGWMWIEFLYVTDAERFLNIVARYEHGIRSFYNRIRQAWEFGDRPLTDAWEYDVYPFDLSVEETEVDGAISESSSGPSDFVFSMCVRFPRSDYHKLLYRMRRYNRGTTKPTR